MKPFIIAVACLTLISCSTNDRKNSLAKMELNGPVKRVLERFYGAREKFGEPEKTYFELMIEYEFDSHGNLIKFSRYNRFEQLEYREISKFDEQQRQIELSHYNSNGDLEYKKMFIPNNAGDPVETITYDSFGKPIKRQVDVYSEAGLRTEMTIYDADEKSNRYEYNYDSLGKINRIRVYDGNGILLEDKPPIKLAPGFGSENFLDKDKHGNWLKSTKSYRICEREISYY